MQVGHGRLSRHVPYINCYCYLDNIFGEQWEDTYRTRMLVILLVPSLTSKVSKLVDNIRHPEHYGLS